jgi:hypothetical protein
MPWFNVDDGFSNSKPVMRIPRRYRASCIGVWTLCGAWSAKELTDGFVPDAVLEEYGATPKIIDLLMDAELWERNSTGVNSDSTGVNFRNWSKWQRTKQQVLDYRAAEAERQHKWREAKKKAADQRVPDAVTEPSRRDTSVSHAVTTPLVTDLSRLPIPKPLPIPKEELKDLASQAPPDTKKRGQRIPEDWCPSETTKAWASENYSHLDLLAEWAAFVNYWRGEGGQRSRKLDWDAAFKSWLHNARAPARNGHTQPPAKRKVNVGLQLAEKLGQDTPALEA